MLECHLGLPQSYSTRAHRRAEELRLCTIVSVPVHRSRSCNLGHTPSCGGGSTRVTLIRENERISMDPAADIPNFTSTHPNRDFRVVQVQVGILESSSNTVQDRPSFQLTGDERRIGSLIVGYGDRPALGQGSLHKEILSARRQIALRRPPVSACE